jgi:hypothetical protein
MHGNRSIGKLDKSDLGWFYKKLLAEQWNDANTKLRLAYRVALAELEFQAVCFVHVKRVRVKHFYIHKPFIEAISRYQTYARW